MAKVLKLGNKQTETLHIGRCPHCDAVSIWSRADLYEASMGRFASKTVECPVCHEDVDTSLLTAKDFRLGTLEHTEITEASFITFTGEKNELGESLVRDWEGNLQPVWIFSHQH